MSSKFSKVILIIVLVVIFIWGCTENDSGKEWQANNVLPENLDTEQLTKPLSISTAEVEKCMADAICKKEVSACFSKSICVGNMAAWARHTNDCKNRCLEEVLGYGEVPW